MLEHEKINYVEFLTKDISASKSFFEQVFGWTFKDYGADYTAFSNSGINGGFCRSQNSSNTEHGAALVVLYSNDLEDTQSKVESAGGTIVKEIFEFPGGRRFQFEEPGGNELAVWSDKGL